MNNRPKENMNKPKIVCLVGSTRFRTAFEIANMDETLKGHIVVSVGMFGHDDYPLGAKYLCADGDENNLTKQMLDELHEAKIDLADEILVINVGGYVGSSTTREIIYASSGGKPVRYMFCNE
jgi:hypothetical protein